MIHVKASARLAVCLTAKDVLTTGSVGIPVEFTFDGWDGIVSKIAVFRAGDVSIDVALLEDRCTVPPEVLVTPGETLTIGVYGTDAEGTVVIPTVYADAGQIRRGAEPSGIEPTPQTQPLIDQLLAAAQAARDAADEAERLAKAVKDAADEGEFDGADGADGNGVWYTTARISGGEPPFVRRRDLIGREGAEVQVHDLLLAPDVGYEGEPTTLYEITSVGSACALNRLCKMKGTDGEDGTSPSVTITEITGGHRITITDEAHPQGQSFDVMDGQGGGSGGDVQSVNGKTGAVELSASDVHALPDTTEIPSRTSQLQNDSGYLTQHQSLAAYRTASEQDVIDRQQNAAIEAKYTKPGTGVPKTDLAAAVQTSLGKADTALQQHQDISGKLDKAQGAANAGKFLVVGSDGNVTTITVPSASGVNF